MARTTAQPWHWLGQTAAIAVLLWLSNLVSVGGGRRAIAVPLALPNSTEATNSPDTFCADDLQASVNRVVRRPQFASARWGVVMQPLQTDAPLYSLNAEALLIPASNIKLFTTAAAIQLIAEQAPDQLLDFQADLTLINRDSHNGRADDLLRGIGGQSQVRRRLEPLGVAADSFIQADGSGLSRENRVQPTATVALLKGMYTTDNGKLFYDSLAVGGVDGTLSNRFKSTSVHGRVHAKTGTLRGVRALSGYLETDHYGTVIFSIVVNQSGQSGRVMIDAIDEMVLSLAQVEPCH